jgi:hypothetical protein
MSSLRKYIGQWKQPRSRHGERYGTRRCIHSASAIVRRRRNFSDLTLRIRGATTEATAYHDQTT